MVYSVVEVLFDWRLDWSGCLVIAESVMVADLVLLPCDYCSVAAFVAGKVLLFVNWTVTCH